MKWYKFAVDHKYVRAYSKIGNMYRYGYGVEASLEEAIKWYTKGVKKKDGESCKILGDLYMDGEEVEQDYEKAWLNYHYAIKYGCKNGGDVLVSLFVADFSRKEK